MNMEAEEVIDYWFSDRMRKSWFSSTVELDREIKQRFEIVWEQARIGELDGWKSSASGALALVIILDQFPLNMFRGEAKGFSTESKAIEVSLYAIEKGYDKELAAEQLGFLFMPLMHSEKMEHQDLSVEMYRRHNLKANIQFAEHHRGIVEKYGRFPHRNEILGRVSTAAELEYLQSDAAFKG